MTPQYQLRDDGLYEVAWPVCLALFPTLLFGGGGVYRYWSDAAFRYASFALLVVGLFIIFYRGLRPRPVVRFTREALLVAPHFMRKSSALVLDQIRELSVRGCLGQRELWSTDLQGAELRLDQSWWPQELVAQVERYLISAKGRIPVPIQIHEPSSPYLNQSSR